MGFESFFFKKESDVHSDTEKDVLDADGVTRRNLLTGIGVFAAAGLVGIKESKADGESSQTPESLEQRRKENVTSIRTYERTLKKYRDILENPNAAPDDIYSVLRTKARFTKELLVGTELDHEAWFRNGVTSTEGSWPSVQAWQEQGMELPRVQFSYQDNASMAEYAHGNYGNAFFVDGIFITNRHIVENPTRTFKKCDVLGNGKDIGACSIEDLETGDLSRFDVDSVDLAWDRRKATQDLHGMLVHIPSIHDERGEDNALDNTDITTGVLVKVSANMIRSESNPEGIISPLSKTDSGDVVDYTQALMQSYFTLVPSRDANEDGDINEDDIKGISGSPFFTDEDCAQKKGVPSGLVWGTMYLTDTNGSRYAVVLVHGPDVLGEMVDEINTIVGPETELTQYPGLQEQLRNAQRKLAEFGHDVSETGEYDEKTQQAVEAFQVRIFEDKERLSSVITGSLDRKTWKQLFLMDEDETLNKRMLYGLPE